MTQRTAWVVLVPLSESFRVAVTGLAAEAGSDLLEWSPAAGEVPAARASAIVVLAGGEEGAAVDLLAQVPPDAPPTYVVGAMPDHRLALSAVQAGASDYFALPDDLDLLRRAFERDVGAARARQAAAQFAEAERSEIGFGSMVGQSAAIQRVVSQAERVAPHGGVTVLIGGETGTGKELLARAIHYHSPRAAAPFVEINCAAIPANLLETELFGHEKGAFTGAIAAKPGLFELAHGGTLFLDEVGNLPLELQPKLLRALEAHEIRRVGGQAVRKVDVRLLAATHVDLAAAVDRGEYRQDLYYRLNVVAITLPPLRERDADVELLAETFIARLATTYGLPIPPLTPELRTALRGHSWPGNVRELRNAIERALVLSPRGTLRPEELQTERRPVATPGLPFPVDLATLNRAAAVRMVDLTGGNKSEAARRLGISRPRLLRLLAGQDTDT